MIKDLDLKNLIDDIEYLKYEASSLHQVIEFVPYTEKPLDGASILEIFLTIDSIQAQIIELLNEPGSESKHNREVVFRRIELSSEEVKERSIDVITSSIIKNRIELLEYLEGNKKSFYEVELNFQDAAISIFELLSKMIKEERALLKNVADLVMTYQKDRQFQREIMNKPRG